MTQHNRKMVRSRRGAAAVLAMLFLVLFTTLTLAMFSLATGNVQSASNLSDVTRAQGAAESGLRWISYRFVHMPRPKRTEGTISPSVMNTLWPQIEQTIIDDMTTGPNRMLNTVPINEQNWTSNASAVTSPRISVETSGATFELDIRQSATDPTVLVVTSTGKYRQSARSVAMTFKVDKKVKFAIVGKVPIQLGRNTIVEGPIAMTTPNKYPPLLMLSDFMHFDATLKTRLENWNAFLQGFTTIGGQPVPNHSGYDNRISLNNAREAQLAQAQGFHDVNGDTFIDEYDFFVERFDSDHDLKITRAEFTNPVTGKVYDDNLFTAIDMIGAPMFAGDPQRDGYMDSIIDNKDGYAKVRGNVTLATSADAWAANLAGGNPPKTINDMIQGTIIPTDPTQPPIRFGATTDDMVDTNPANFEQCAEEFHNRVKINGNNPPNLATPPAAGTVIQAKTITAAAANGGAVLEETPKGSKSFQAVYKRPVFKNVTFKNCVIPKGLNALFDNCKFQGVTFVETNHDITNTAGQTSTSSSDGMSWARRATTGTSTVDVSGSFKDTNNDGKWDQYKVNGMSNFANVTQWDANNQPILPSGAGSFAYGTGGSDKKSLGSTKGNNTRFNNCTFEGPLAGNYATAYSHFSNTWEFTGATQFNNQLDQTATIVSPQVNIEMGSFTNPGQAPSTLIGVVVVGNIDIRGTSNVDGSIIVTGDGAGNTTLAYFGADDSSTDPNNPMPEGGWGRLNIRYNPTRALPDGINLAVDILPQPGSYSEVLQCASN